MVDTLVRILEPRPSDSVYDPTCGSGGMLVHSADFLREGSQHATQQLRRFLGGAKHNSPLRHHVVERKP